MHYYNFHIGDYKSHTHHLSPIEDLAYRRLLDLYYLTEKPIVADQAARLIGLREHGHDVLCILMEFFTETPEGFINKRADEEIDTYHSRIEQASLAGKASAEARKNKRSTVVEDQLNSCEANVQPTNNHKPITNNQIKPIREPEGFAEFWAAYPKRIGKGAAEKSWSKLQPPIETVISAIRTQADTEQWKKDGGQFIPNPATWLNQRRWEDTLSLDPIEDMDEIIETPSGKMPRKMWKFILGVQA